MIFCTSCCFSVHLKRGLLPCLLALYCSHRGVLVLFCSVGSQINNNINNTIDLDWKHSTSLCFSQSGCSWGFLFFFLIEAQCTIITTTASVLYAPLPPCSFVTIVTSPITITWITSWKWCEGDRSSSKRMGLLQPAVSVFFFLYFCSISTLLHLISPPVAPPPSCLRNRVIAAVHWAHGRTEWTGNYEWISSHS